MQLPVSRSRRLDLALEGLGGTGKRLVECCSDGRLADHDEPRLAGKEFLGRVIQPGRIPHRQSSFSQVSAIPASPLGHGGADTGG
jgi:hypothetical protein